MSSEQYNGWSNLETWAVNRFIDTDETILSQWLEVAQEEWWSHKDATEHRSADATTSLADRMEQEFAEAAPDLEGVWSDLLGAARERINWNEIAAGLLFSRCTGYVKPSWAEKKS